MSARRRLLLQSVAVGLAPLSRQTRSAPRARNNVTSTGRTLRALLDTLIPEDETPSASALGIDAALFDRARRSVDYRRVIEEGVGWLDSAAATLGARSFAAASEAQRIAIVQQAERAALRTLPRVLFDRVREDALQLYYAEPRTWRALGYFGPPQPMGFRDFERPPARGR
jgi:hypothetical protein